MPETDKLHELMKKICYLERILVRYQGIPRDYGISEFLYMSELYMIETIGLNEPVSAAELARIKNATPSAISQIIKRLDSKGLLLKDSFEGNKKTIYIKLSEEGRKAYDLYRETNEKNYLRYISRLPGLTGEDLEKMTEFISIITDEFIQELSMLDM